ncbi:fused MFS/spermidine synthase [Myxococcota bacterium]|nr:fused MFS/spermidine synthase [Myxococcota bacterium]
MSPTENAYARDRAADPTRAALYLLFAVSGATALVYEVVWVRMITLVFGATQPAISTVLAAFMGGLAIGGLAGARVADRVRPLRAYAVLELGIGAYALAFPLLMDGAADLYRAYWRVLQPGPGASVAFHLVSVLGLLLIPTAAMGATLPLLSRAVVRRADQAGTRVGGLYAANTLGAVLGVGSAGFLLLPYAGIRSTLLIAAATNALLAIVAWRMGAAAEREREADPSEGVPAPAATAGAPAVRPAPPRWAGSAAAAAFAVSGACAMALEVAWSRVLTLVLDNSVYSFSLMLLAFLSGLAGGTAAATRLARRIRPLPALVACLVGAGLAAWGTSWTFGQMPFWFVGLYGLISGHDDLLYGMKLLLAGAVMMPATLFMGAVMPFAVAVRVKDARTVGSDVGRLYAWNTVGAIAGALSAGFLLVPGIGIQPTVRAVVAVQVAAGLALALALRGRTRLAAAGAAAAALALTALAFPRWDPLLMSAGMYTYVDNLSDYSREAVLNHAISDFEVLYYAEGPSTVVIVGRSQGSGNVWLANNGKVDASTSADMPTQILLGHLPFHFAARADRVLLVGLASGITAGSVLTHDLGQLEILEIEPSVIEASRYFSEWNGNPLADPRVRMIAGDARNHLFLADRPYDVIVNEPSNPWISGVSNLFTREFFQLGRDRLAPDGVFCQWVQLYGMGTDDLKSLLRTFSSVFPYALVYSPVEAGDLILVGSARPLQMDLPRVEAAIQAERPAADLSRIGVRGVADLLTYYLMDEVDLAPLTRGAPLNTDDNMRIEFSAPRMLHYRTEDANFEMLLQASTGPFRLMERALAGASPGEAARRFREIEAAYLARDRYGEAILAGLHALGWTPDDDALRARIEELRAEVLGRGEEGAGARRSRDEGRR